MTAPIAGSSTPNVKVTMSESKGTDYVILEQTSLPTATEEKGWREFARENARSDDAAIKQALDGNTHGGTFVAVPARSFKAVKVTPHTTTTFKLENAT